LIIEIPSTIVLMPLAIFCSMFAILISAAPAAAVAPELAHFSISADGKQLVGDFIAYAQLRPI
jgi:hypothetical protein